MKMNVSSDMRVGAWLLVGLLVARATGDVIDYDNTTGFFQRAYPGGLDLADDIHRSSAADIVGLEIGYYTFSAGPRDLRLRFCENHGIDGSFPPPLVAEYFFAGLPGDIGEHKIRLDLPAPLAAPQDLWVGLLIDANIIFYWPPTIGSSNDYVLRDGDLDGTADTLIDSEALDDFYLRIYTVPEPGGLGIVLLLLPALRRFSRREH